MLAEDNVQPSQLKDRILFMSMYTDVNSGQLGSEEKCKGNATRVASVANDNSNQVGGLSMVRVMKQGGMGA